MDLVEDFRQKTAFIHPIILDFQKVNSLDDKQIKRLVGFMLPIIKGGTKVYSVGLKASPLSHLKNKGLINNFNYVGTYQVALEKFNLDGREV